MHTLVHLAIEHQLLAAVFAVLAVLLVVNEYAELDVELTWFGLGSRPTLLKLPSVPLQDLWERNVRGDALRAELHRCICRCMWMLHAWMLHAYFRRGCYTQEHIHAYTQFPSHTHTHTHTH